MVDTEKERRPYWTYLSVADRQKFSERVVATEFFLESNVKVLVSGLTEKQAKKTAQQTGHNIFNVFRVPLIEEQQRFFQDRGKVKEAFGGQYVVTSDFNSQEVIAADKNPAEALAKARQAGYDNPVIVFITPKGVKTYPSVWHHNTRGQ